MKLEIKYDFKRTFIFKPTEREVYEALLINGVLSPKEGFPIMHFNSLCIDNYDLLKKHFYRIAKKRFNKKMMKEAKYHG